jgi:two-component system LytT family sensor kinase
VYAQPPRTDSFGHNFIFEMIAKDKRTGVAEPVVISVRDTAVDLFFDNFKTDTQRRYDAEPKNAIMLGVKLNPSLKRYFSAAVQSVSKDYFSYIISDSSDAVLIALGINAGNVTNYRYHVVVDDSMEIVPWSSVPKLEKQYGAKQAYGFLGKYNAPGRRVMIEVINARNYSIRDGVIFDWRINYRPLISQITVGSGNKYFNLAYTGANKGFASRFDPGTGAPLDLAFPADSVHSILFRFKKQETVVHTAYLIRSVGRRTDTIRLGFVDHYGYYDLEKKNFSQPGHYEFVVMQQQKYPVWDEDQLLRIPFEVLPAPLFARGFTLRQAIPYLIAAVLLLALLLIGWRQFAKRKLAKMEYGRNAALLQLKSIRAQLNPHFMFNALSSIQNLMNKNALLEANRYLSKFAGLTRKVLHTSEKEMISLAEEMEIAADYLQMEQLRYGFQYQLKVAEGLDTINIEIPAMIVQPFIENSVKHGMALSKEHGLIVVAIVPNGSSLVISVLDNGKGFDASAKNGFGLKLSRERIELLNQLHRNQPAQLRVQSEPGNTIVTITLNNWL